MSVIKIICVFAVFVFTQVAYAASIEKSKLFRIQEQVLLELAAEGVVESYRVLAEFYQNRASRRNNFHNKSIYWRIKAAQFGHANSLYHLGQLGLSLSKYQKQLRDTYVEQPDSKYIWRREALIMISEAAILGNQHAKTDLVVLPKILPVSYQEIEVAVNEALLRLHRGELINCNFFVCKADHTKNARPRQLLKYQKALSHFKQEQKRLKCRKLKQCLELMLASVRFINQKRIKRFQIETANGNRSKIKKNQRLHNEITERLAAGWDQQSNMDRNQQRIQAAEKIVDYYADKDRHQLKAKISELLEKINYHRGLANKIKLSDIMEILSQP